MAETKDAPQTPEESEDQWCCDTCRRLAEAVSPLASEARQRIAMELTLMPPSQNFVTVLADDALAVLGHNAQARDDKQACTCPDRDPGVMHARYCPRYTEPITGQEDQPR